MPPTLLFMPRWSGGGRVLCLNLCMGGTLGRGCTPGRGCSYEKPMKTLKLYVGLGWRGDGSHHVQVTEPYHGMLHAAISACHVPKTCVKMRQGLGRMSRGLVRVSQDLSRMGQGLVKMRQGWGRMSQGLVSMSQG